MSAPDSGEIEAERDAFARDAEADAEDAKAHTEREHAGYCQCGSRIRGLTIKVCEIGHIQPMASRIGKEERDDLLH